ncbi:hypothetical protein [Burkholderia glumae]|uniref:hypothetical protein n=1 Tax=Burkholderia glumae TaxID=337 RepID=UPI002151844A|nr:hypothetical protein [Burkholderia glumae]
MSESKQQWTPGPWSLTTVPTSIGSCHKIGPFPSAGDRRETCACVYADGIRIGIDEKIPAAVELFANAKLIAAAPELVEALQVAMRAASDTLFVLRDILRNDGGADPRLENLADALDKATDIGYAALAKATGEQS